MIECETTIRKWGNSLGITLPKDVVEIENIRENEKIRILIMKQNNLLKETFGVLKDKLKNSSQQLKNEIRKELYNA